MGVFLFFQISTSVARPTSRYCRYASEKERSRNIAGGSKILWAEETKTRRLLKRFLILPVRETHIYTDSSFFFLLVLDGSAGMLFPLNTAAQLRVLYRSSSSGLDWPKSISAGSALKPEPSAGQQEKCKVYSFCFC